MEMELKPNLAKLVNIYHDLMWPSQEEYTPGQEPPADFFHVANTCLDIFLTERELFTPRDFPPLSSAEPTLYHISHEIDNLFSVCIVSYPAGGMVSPRLHETAMTINVTHGTGKINLYMPNSSSVLNTHLRRFEAQETFDLAWEEGHIKARGDERHRRIPQNQPYRIHSVSEEGMIALQLYGRHIEAVPSWLLDETGYIKLDTPMKPLLDNRY